MKTKYYSSLTVAVLAAIFLSSSLVYGLTEKEKHQIKREQLKEKNLKLKALNAETRAYNQLNKQQKQDQLQAMRAKLKERKQLMKDMAKDDPKEFLNNLLTKEERENLPEDMKGDVEKEVKVKGHLEVYVVEGDQLADAVTKYTLQNKGETQEYIPLSEVNNLGGKEIAVSGYQMDQTIIAPCCDENAENAVENNASVQNGTLGEQKTVVLLLNFPDFQSQPFTKAIAQGKVFTDPDSLNNYVKEVSYNQTFLSGQTYGWFTMPGNISNYCLTQTPSGFYTNCDFPKMRADALGVADSSVDFSNKDRVIMIFNGMTGASGTIGKTVGIQTLDGAINASFSYLYATLINGDPIQNMTMYHEFGHNLGLMHSGSWDCGTNLVGSNLDNLEQDCVVHAYGDGNDAMGISYRHYSAQGKERLGFIPVNQVQTKSSNGNYLLEQYELPSNGIKTIKIPVGHYLMYSLEYRQPVGFNAVMTDPASSEVPIDGVSVKLHHQINGVVSNVSSVTLEKLAPPAPAVDFSVKVGQPFNDPYRNITVSLVSKTAQGVTINIQSPNFSVNSPSNLSAPAADMYPHLSWNDNSNNEIKFIIQKSLNEDMSNAVSIEVPANTTSYTDTNVVAFKRYYYTVKADSGDLYSSTTNEIYVDVTSNLQCGNGIVDSSVGETCDDSNTANGDGCSNTCRIEPNLFPIIDTLKVTSNFGNGPEEVMTIEKGKTVQFFLEAHDPDGTLGYPIFGYFGNMTPVKYLWDFNGGQIGSLGVFVQNPVVTYPTAGTYTIKISIWDNRGAEVKKTITLNVVDPDVDPIANLMTPTAEHGLVSSSVTLRWTGFTTQNIKNYRVQILSSTGAVYNGDVLDKSIRQLKVDNLPTNQPLMIKMFTKKGTVWEVKSYTIQP